jgi:DNA polymerase-3 subunit beta
MDMTISRQSLAWALAHLSGVVRPGDAPKSSVLLDASDGGLRVSGTDLETAASATVAAEVRGGGRIVADHRRLLDIVKSMACEAVRIEADAEPTSMLVTGGSARFDLLTTGAHDYPRLPVMAPSSMVPVDSAKLRDALTSVACAMGQDESRPNLAGVLLRVSESGGVEAVATDGHRLAHAQTGDIHADAPAVIVPRRAALQMARILDTVGSSVLYGATDGHVGLAMGPCSLVARTIDATYPDWRQVVPRGDMLSWMVRRDAMASALLRLSLLAQDRRQMVRLDLATSELKLSTESQERGRGRDSLEVEYDGAPMALGICVAYLRDALAGCRGDEVEMSTRGELSPIVVRSPGDATTHVVMPMRLVGS